jgi:RNA polymerase sigma-B factor
MAKKMIGGRLIRHLAGTRVVEATGTRVVEATVTMHAELQALSDNALLARFRTLAHDSAEHEAICEILVTRYTGLVRSCVRQYRGSPEAAEDLMQAGYVGLLKAINNFDPDYGDSLMAYARPCVSGEIKRHFRDKRWQLRVRRQSQELLLEMRTAEEDLTQQLGRSPDDGELARKLNVPEADVLEARSAHLAFSTYSLDAPLSDQDESGLLAEVLGQEDQAVIHAIDIESLNAHVGELPEREQRVLMLRFYGNLTQDQIGHRLGISQMHVSRLLNRALAYLRHQLTTDPAETG